MKKKCKDPLMIGKKFSYVLVIIAVFAVGGFFATSKVFAVVELEPQTIVSYTISETTISPNNDGVKDSTSIDVAFSGPVNYLISIKSGADTVKNWDGLATNPDAKVWDGKNAGGILVPNGTYTVEISGNNIPTDNAQTIVVDVPVISDADNDTIADENDNCPNVANQNQSDADGDGVGSVCDNAPNNANPGQEDNDNDRIGNVADNCSSVANADQADDDGDGLGNACDQYMCRVTGVEVNGDGKDNDCDGYTDNVADTTAPKIVSVIETTPTTIDVKFDESLMNNTVHAPSVGDFEVYKWVHEVLTIASVEYFDSTKTVTIHLSASTPLLMNESYYVKIVNNNPTTISDLVGNILFSSAEEYITDYSLRGYVDDPSVNGQIAGTVTLNLTTNDQISTLTTACLKYKKGDTEYPIGDCKANSDRNWYSYSYAPSFTFSWDTTAVTDGNYSIFADLADLAGTTFRTPLVAVVVNNYSEGTAGNPSPITTCQELQNIKNHASWYYEMKNDVDCAGFRNWQPINNFKGELNGKHFSVKNLTISTGDNSGIFGDIQSGAKITGVNFHNVNITCGSTYCGGVSNVNWGTIEETSLVGTFVGNGKAGGFASQNSGTISKCYADLTMSGQLGYAGLIAGQNVGQYGYGGVIVNSYARGSMTAGGNMGGLVGLNESGSITKSYSTVQVGAGQNGGLIGWLYQGGSQADSYWDIQTSGFENMCGSTAYNSPENCNDEHGYSTEKMKQQDTFVGLDFESIWRINSEVNDGYPYLHNVSVFKQTPKDMTNPVITLTGDASVSVYLGDAYVDAGATAIDDRDGDITAKIIINNTVNTAVLGQYFVTYDVDDSSGNEANQIARTVNVVARQEENHNNGGGGGGGGGAVIPPSNNPIKVLLCHNGNTIEVSQAGALDHLNHGDTVGKCVVVENSRPQGQVLGETSKFIFTINLRVGSRGVDVTELQKRLRTEGFFTYPTDTGYFGPITKASVIAYQKAHGISPTSGFCGPLTRAELNK